MAEDSDLEKTEQASQQRLDKAREEGDVPRSRELSVFVNLLASGGGIWLLGGGLVAALQTFLGSNLRIERAEAYDTSAWYGHFSHSLVGVALAFAPLAGVVVLGAILAPVLLGGWLFSLQAINMDLARVNPLSGLANIFTIRTVVELGKATAKAVLVTTVAWLMLSHNILSMLGLGLESTRAGLGHMASIMWHIYVFVTLSLGIVALIDVPYQLWSYANKYKMTRQELRQEARESEGDPQIRAKIRSQQREMARRRMMTEVPKADVVVTNPTHFAVALKYAQQGNRAPVVVAKGADEVAARIRELAAEHAVPLLEAPALARALYRHVELEQEIPDVLYSAVAEVLAYVFQLRAWRDVGGRMPVLPDKIVVPAGMDPFEEVAAEPAAYLVAEGDLS
jgi:flagellar biosynthetic protein FlhB